ncbi:MAG: hypothetical protein WC959_12705 [Kiritimatiellales bacterium]
MGIILSIILGGAIIFGLFSYISSRNSDPKERVREAAGAAAVGGAATTGCLLQLMIQTLPFLIGIILLGLLIGSCS